MICTFVDCLRSFCVFFFLKKKVIMQLLQANDVVRLTILLKFHAIYSNAICSFANATSHVRTFLKYPQTTKSTSKTATVTALIWSFGDLLYGFNSNVLLYVISITLITWLRWWTIVVLGIYISVLCDSQHRSIRQCAIRFIFG